MHATSHEYQAGLDYIMNQAHDIEGKIEVVPQRIEWKKLNPKPGCNPYIDGKTHSAVLMAECEGKLGEAEFSEEEILSCQPGSSGYVETYTRITVLLARLFMKLKEP